MKTSSYFDGSSIYFVTDTKLHKICLCSDPPFLYQIFLPYSLQSIFCLYPVIETSHFLTTSALQPLFQVGIFPLLASSNSLPVPSSLSHCPGSLCAHHSLTVGMPPGLSPLQSSSDLTHFQILTISFL